MRRAAGQFRKSTSEGSVFVATVHTLLFWFWIHKPEWPPRPRPPEQRGPIGSQPQDYHNSDCLMREKKAMLEKQVSYLIGLQPYSWESTVLQNFPCLFRWFWRLWLGVWLWLNSAGHWSPGAGLKTYRTTIIGEHSSNLRGTFYLHS